MLPDNSVAAVVGASTSEAMFPEVETLATEAMERGKEELLMNEGSTTGSLSSPRPLDVKTNHIRKGVGTSSHSARDLNL